MVGLTDVVQIATGGFASLAQPSGHSGAVTESGALYCWGSGLRSATGLGDPASRFVPQRVRFF